MVMEVLADGVQPMSLIAGGWRRLGILPSLAGPLLVKHGLADGAERISSCLGWRRLCLDGQR